MQWLFRLLVYLVVPTAAFLTFLLQPIVGKQLMPRYGGTAGTWMTISLFFQTALLGGYVLASWLLHRPRARAQAILLGLAVAAPLTAKLPPWNLHGWSEWTGVLTGLTLSLLPTLLLTTSIGIVLQGWIRARDGRVPYFLYGISNLGSLLALLAYPFVVEPAVGLSVQVHYVRILLWILAGGTIGLVLLEKRRTGPAVSPDPGFEEEEDIPVTRVALWMVIAFTTCSMMLGGVRILSAEIGSNPVAWLLPLGMYLLSFTVTFSGWWRSSLTLGTLAAFGLALYGYMATKGIANTVLSYWPRFWLVSMIGLGTLCGHGFLFQLRPIRRFSFFYLMIAAAGTLAGLFASVGAPLIFNRNLEFVGAGFTLAIIGGLGLVARRGFLERAAFIILALGPAAWYGLDKVLQDRRLTVTKITYLRNYYSTIVLTDSPAYISASNETTLHGTQLHNEADKDTPTTYYTRGSGGGMVIEALQKKYPAIRLGVIGLGTGTLAAYSRPADTMIFWDINPLALKVANDYFTFVKDAKGTVDIRLMDGRIGVRTAKERFDALVVDAFSGDYIPLHLLTREALQEYVERVGDGIILFHVSNRYIDLLPVIGANARHLGLSVRNVTATPNELVGKAEQAAKTKYVLVYPKSRDSEVDGWIMEQMKRSDYDYQIVFPAEMDEVNWTDDRHAILDLLWK